jgi:hypothetical protein
MTQSPPYLVECNPPSGAPAAPKKGYRRSWTDDDRLVNNVTGDPVQPKYMTVKQKVSGIEYSVWNGDYKRSWTPLDIQINNLSGNPDQPDILSGWNGDYIKNTWWNGTIFEYDVADMSEKYVKQSLYRGFYVDAEKVFGPDNDYIARDVCNQEVAIEIVADPNAPGGRRLVPVGNAILSLEDDRDNVFKTEYSFQAIELEVNTTLSHIDYTNDYMVREEDDVALSMEQGGLIEPMGI